eukprot:1873722-Pyramimonas_sp.AAC.1
MYRTCRSNQGAESTVGQPYVCSSLSTTGNIRRTFGGIFEMPCAEWHILVLTVDDCRLYFKVAGPAALLALPTAAVCAFHSNCSATANETVTVATPGRGERQGERQTTNFIRVELYSPVVAQAAQLSL